MSGIKKTNAPSVKELSVLKKQLVQYKSTSKQIQREARTSQKLLDCINNAQTQFIRDADPHDLFNRMLDDLLSLTDSEYGFIGELLYTPDGVPYLKTHATTNIAWDKETQELYDKYSRHGMEFRNLNTLFGAVITSGDAVISNDPSTDPRRGGLPKGHPPLNSFLGLPFYYGKKMVGTVGIANRGNGYDEKLVTYLTPFLNMCANIIEAYRMDRLRKQGEEVLIKREAYLEVIAYMGQKLLSCRVEGDVIETGVCIYSILNLLGTTAGVNRVYIYENSPGKAADLQCNLRSEWVAGGKESHNKKPLLRNISYGIDGLSRWAKTMNGRKTISGPVRDFPKAERDTLEMQGVYSLLVVPIFTDQGWWGFLGLDDGNTDHEWSNEEIVLLQSAATTLGQFYNTVRIEAEKASLQTQLSYSKRMESIGTLAGGIAHNFNNILCGILGYVSLIKLEMSPDNEFYENLCKIDASAQRASLLTRRLLGFVQKRKSLLIPLSCDYIINTTISLLTGSLRKNIAVENTCYCYGYEILGDENQIQQAILNLCHNAHDAMPDGGTIQIIGKIKKFNVHHQIRSFKIAPGMYFTLQVIDSGVGMTKKTLDHIFEPFFTTKEVGEGVGLGLATVYGTMKNHKGYIDIRSKRKTGTTCTLYFPATRIKQHKKKK